MPDFWPDEWVRTLKEIEATEFDYVISGHGPATEPAIEPASVVTEQREYLEDLMAVVKTAMDAGTRNPNKLREDDQTPEIQTLAGLRCLAANEHRAYLGFLPHEVVEKRV